MDELTVDGPMIRRRAHGDAAARYWALARTWVVCLALTIACQSALAQATYTIKPIGVVLGHCNGFIISANGFNGADEVTGAWCAADGYAHGFLWKNDGKPLVDFGPSEAGAEGEGIAINASGLVVGQAQDSTGWYAFESSGDGTPLKRIYDSFGGGYVTPSGINAAGQLTGNAGTTDLEHAFLWKNNGSPLLDLGTLGSNVSEGNAINASGQVAGDSYLKDGTTLHPFIWKNDGTPIIDLGTLGGDFAEGDFINASGQVAGISLVSGATRGLHAYLWRNDGSPMQDLGTVGGWDSEPAALNDAGQVTGYSSTHRSNGAHAFVWLNDGTPMRDLGTLGGESSEAFGLNSSGQVTGWAEIADNSRHAFLWRNDGTRIQDLNKLIDPTDPLKPYVTLTVGDFINDRGDIAAEGTDSRTGLAGVYLIESSGVTTSALTLTPRSLAFGAVPVNTSSAAQPVTVTNTTSNAVAITGIALRGTAPKQFAFTDDCGKSLAGHSTCTLKAIFSPTTKGAKTAFLDVNGGGGGLRSVTLTGTGT